MSGLPRLSIPPDLNLYDIYQCESIENVEIAICLRSLHETFRHFHIHKRNYRNTGNVILRFSHWIMEATESGDEIVIEDEADTEVKLISRMYEHYADLAQQRLKP